MDESAHALDTPVECAKGRQLIPLAKELFDRDVDQVGGMVLDRNRRMDSRDSCIPAAMSDAIAKFVPVSPRVGTGSRAECPSRSTYAFRAASGVGRRRTTTNDNAAIASATTETRPEIWRKSISVKRSSGQTPKAATPYPIW